jgi:hypothetical protein
VYGFAHRLSGGDVHGRQPAARRYDADIPVGHQSYDLSCGADDWYEPRIVLPHHAGNRSQIRVDVTGLRRCGHDVFDSHVVLNFLTVIALTLAR